MTEWREVPLGEVLELKRGYDLPKRARADGPFPIISSSGISGSHVEAKVVGPGVVTGRYGTLGQVFYVAHDFWPLNTSLYVRDFKGSNKRFAALLLESMDLGQHDGAAAVPGLNRNQLHTLPVLVPERHAQDRIATIIGSIDDLIENNRRRLEVLEEMARAIYRECFVHFRYPGHEDIPLVDSPLGPIPDGWRAGTLADLAVVDRQSIRPDRTGDEPFDHYSIPAFDAGAGPARDLGSAIQSGKYLLDSPAILVSKLNPRINRVWYAEPGSERRSVTSTEFLILRPTPCSNLDHLYLLASERGFRDQLVALTGGTSGSHQRAKPADVLGLSVPLPAEHLTSRLDNVGPLLRQARQLRRQSLSLAGLRDLLLPKLVTGKLDVSQLDLDALGEGALA